MVEGALESDGSLAGNVLELTQMLTRYNQELRDRNEEKSRLSGVQAEFKKHLAWQKQRAHALNRNVEKLFNESSWLEQKTTEVRQDAQLVAHELRQCKAEVDQLKSSQDDAARELELVEEEIRLEKEATKTLGQICSEGGKAITVHSSHRDTSKKEAEDCKLEAFRLKDRAQKVAYRLNGLALDTF